MFNDRRGVTFNWWKQKNVYFFYRGKITFFWHRNKKEFRVVGKSNIRKFK